uniref:AAA+ ATPase domain-containing protein n=2 Tax=Vibrio coralliilyticus TaxID=190893 RepID=M1FTP4_9VIBR|nr:hypothetical protein [Vibrio coralliilyticus]
MRTAAAYLEYRSMIADETIRQANFKGYIANEEEEVKNKRLAGVIAQEYIDGAVYNTLFTGNTGSGKSHLAMSMLKMINKFSKPQKKCLFISVDEMFRRIKGSWKNSESEFTEENMVDLLSEVDVLVLDDIGSDIELFEAIASKNYLIRIPERIVTHIDGIAASGGSIIAMAGEEIIMPKDSEMMIHNPWTIGYGNAHDFRRLADELDTANVSVQETYMDHFTDTREKLIELLDAESWLTAQEALSYGLATSIVDETIEPDLADEDKGTIENKSNKTNLKGTQKVAFLNLSKNGGIDK